MVTYLLAESLHPWWDSVERFNIELIQSLADTDTLTYNHELHGVLPSIDCNTLWWTRVYTDFTILVRVILDPTLVSFTPKRMDHMQATSLWFNRKTKHNERGRTKPTDFTELFSRTSSIFEIKGQILQKMEDFDPVQVWRVACSFILGAYLDPFTQDFLISVDSMCHR
ncbi:hypothetical protein NE237_005329 [Protea cynaroides]|uniref:Uncharacterized protein n=1 Tax=Protea cynaroides TaxID=273540 RepID=A0A9Q0KKN6_9MAGN|nr:hypothetical protein NE237_005329 [Protea cynaroides]